MKLSNFVRACRRIERSIASFTERGSGSHKTRAAMTKDLALWACTNYSGQSHTHISKLKLPWKRWDVELDQAGLLVAAALRLITVDGFSLAKATSYSRVPAGDLREALRLLKVANLSPHDIAKRQSPDVELALARVRERVQVWLEPRAVEDMLLGAAEGYKVAPGKGAKYTEVFGLCFGSVRRKSGRSALKDVFVNVARVATQLRAKGTSNSVMPNSKSLASQVHIGDQFFPHLEVVGDYHTHPYKSFVELKANVGWEYSSQDERSLPRYIEEIRSHEHADPLFSLVVAVASGGKASSASRRKAPNVVQICVGDLFFVIGAYRVLLDGSYDRKVHLSVSSLVR